LPPVPLRPKVLDVGGGGFSVRVGGGVRVWGSLGGGADICSGSHDWLLPAVVTFAVTVLSAAAARLTPEAAISRRLPAARVTAAGRACAKRM
jgi:hypothetical protein